GSGRIALQFGAKIDTGMVAGTEKYRVEVKWSKGSYDAGTVDYTVFWSSAGEAYFGNSSNPIIWNGAYPATYLGDGWELTFEGTGMDPYILVGPPIVYMDSPAVLAEGWADANTYYLGAGKHFPEYVGFTPIRMPLLDDPG